MDRKLIFLDVDNTLTHAGSYEPPESAIRAVKRARELGHKVFLCSGRNYGMLEPLLKYGFDGGIASCGGYVFAGDDVIYNCPMTEEQKHRVWTLLAENGVFLSIEGKDASFTDHGAVEYGQSHNANRDLSRMIKAVWIELGPQPIEDYDDRPVYKIVFVSPGADCIGPAIEELGDELMFIVHDFSQEDCLFGELISREFNKGSAVRLVAEKLGFDIADTIGFGDSMLDIEMIQAVGTSVCMDTGSPRLKELSDLVCPGVDEDGIEWGFKELGLI